MPSILITTSRRTSNRIRTFVRDLHSVISGSERFNRGGMSLDELVGRMGQSSAKAAFIVSSFRGNPGTLQVIDRNGLTVFEIRIASALLRRETFKNGRTRINRLSSVAVHDITDSIVKEFGHFIANLTGASYITFSEEMKGPSGTENESIMILNNENGNVLWTIHRGSDMKELGPRIRISMIQRYSDE